MTHLIRTVLAALVASTLVAQPAHAQVATTTYSVVSGAWTDLGAGPLRLQLLTQSSDLVVCVADAQPAASAQCFVVPIFDQTPKDFPTASHVWAKARTAATQIAVAPITAGGAVSVSNFPATQIIAQPDARGSGTLNVATANAAYSIALNNGEGVVSFSVTGLAASGATLAVEASDDGGTTWSSVNGIAPGTGILFSTLTADQQFRINSGGRTNVRLRVSAIGAGTIAVASNASMASSAVALSSPLPGPLPVGGNVLGKVGADPNSPFSPAVGIAVAPTVQNVGYVAGNSLGGLQTIAAARVAGGGGMIVGVDWRSAGGSTGQIYIYGWTKSPAATCADKVAFAEAAGDIANRIPGFPLSLTPSSPGSWDAVTRAVNANMSSAFKNADTSPSMNLYFCVVTAGSVTPASTSDLTMTLSVVQN